MAGNAPALPRGARAAVLAAALLAGAAAEPSLHCCFAPASTPIVLSCEASPGSVISAVPFAVIADASALPPWRDHRHPVCGEDAAPPGARAVADVAPRLRDACMNRTRCEVTASESWGADHEVLLRWTCAHDQTADGPGRGDGAALPELPLRVQNGAIVDARGERFRLQGVNWAGGHIIGVPSGLDRAPIADLARLVRSLGFNIVRMPYSVEVALTNPVPDAAVVAANPGLRGLRALDVMDTVVAELGRAGVLVWLDVHMLESDWCCTTTDCNGLWFNQAYSMEHWLEALRTMAARYAASPTVVGFGLKNEIRPVCGGLSWGKGAFCNISFYDPGLPADGCVAAAWSTGPEHLQLKRAAEAGGRAVLGAAKGKLVSFGGLDYSTSAENFTVDLPTESFVFEAHEYSWAWWSNEVGDLLEGDIPAAEPELTERAAKRRCLALGDGCAGIVCSGADGRRCMLRARRRAGEAGQRSQRSVWLTHRKKRQQDFSDFEERLDEQWGFIAAAGVTPIWVSEFGFSHGDARNSHPWLARFGDYVRRREFDWAYWELSSDQVGGTGRRAGAGEGFGILNYCYTAAASAVHHDAVLAFSSAADRRRLATGAAVASDDSVASSAAARGPFAALLALLAGYLTQSP